MGKRKNKNKSKKSLENSVSEKKPNTLLEQDGARRRQSSPKPLLSETNMESSQKNFEKSNSEIKKSNFHTSEKSNTMKYVGHTYNVPKSKVTNDDKDKSIKKDSAVLSASEVRSKQEKKIISNQGINESKLYLCDDLVSGSYNSKDILNSSSMKKTHIDQKCSRIENNQKYMASEENWDDTDQKSENKKKKLSNELLQNRDVIIKQHLFQDKLTNDYKDKTIKKDSSVLSVTEVKSKQEKKIIPNQCVNESEFNLCEDLFSDSYDYDSKDILNPSHMKKKRIDQKENRTENNQTIVTSGKNWDDAGQKSEKSKPNKQLVQNRDVTNFVPTQVLFQDKPLSKNISQYRSFESKDVSGNKNAPNFSGTRPKYKQNPFSETSVKDHENCFFEKYSYKSGNGCKERNYEQKLNSKCATAKENFVSSVNEYNHSKRTFSSIYQKWLPERESTLEKLRSILKEVQDTKMKFNEAQASFKDCTAVTRRAKISTDSMLVGFLASAVTMACDAASGLSSFAEAVNIDSFQRKFQEIMDHDAEITKDLYESRSQCVVEYQGIEEVMKKFHCNTLSSTVNNISDTLEVGKYWAAMKKAYNNDDMASLMNIAGNFFTNACESEVLGKVCNSLETYAADNPAALEGCKSTCKSMYESVNILSPIYNRKSLRGKLDSGVSGYLMVKDMEEAEHLKSNYSKSKLESQIEDAIDLLESELEEISDMYNRLFKNKNQNSLQWE